MKTMTISRPSTRWRRTVAAAMVLALALLVPLGSGPAAAADPPTVHVDQTTGLIDGQAVAVTGTGANPADAFGLFQCTAAPTSNECDPAVTGFPTADGTFEGSLTVHRILQNGTDCYELGACVIRVIVFDPANQPVTVNTPISFSTPFSGSLWFDPGPVVVAADGSATVTGTISCRPEVDGTLSVTIAAGGTHVVAPSLDLHCGMETAPWAVTFPSGLDALPDGDAQIQIGFAETGSPAGVGLGGPIELVHEVPATPPEPPLSPVTAPVAEVPAAPGAATPVAAQPAFTG